jgi:hypothetical protein
MPQPREIWVGSHPQADFLVTILIRDTKPFERMI